MMDEMVYLFKADGYEVFLPEWLAREYVKSNFAPQNFKQQFIEQLNRLSELPSVPLGSLSGNYQVSFRKFKAMMDEEG